MKRAFATKVGATDAFADLGEAAELARSLTNGQGADSVIICVGVLQPDDVTAAFSAIRKAGTVVCTAAAGDTPADVTLGLLELTMFQKRIQGSIYGMMSPAGAIPQLLGLWQSGQLLLDELISRRYTLDEVNQGYADLKNGDNIRGLVVFDH